MCLNTDSFCDQVEGKEEVNWPFVHAWNDWPFYPYKFHSWPGHLCEKEEKYKKI